MNLRIRLSHRRHTVTLPEDVEQDTPEIDAYHLPTRWRLETTPDKFLPVEGDGFVEFFLECIVAELLAGAMLPA